MSFTASTSHISHLSEVFQALSAVGNQGIVIVNSKGVIIYCEHNHILNCQAIIDVSLFSSFNLAKESQSFEQTDISDSDGDEEPNSLFLPSQESNHRQGTNGVNDIVNGTSESTGTNDTELRFGIELNLINHSFEVLSNSKDIICYLSYNGEGTPFTVEFEDNLMSELIEFLTFYVDIEYPYDLSPEEQQQELVINFNEIEYEMILKSDILTNILQDLMQISTDELYIYLSKKELEVVNDQLQFISNGPIGLLKLIYPNERTVLEKLEIHNSTLTHQLSSFKFQLFIKCFKAVKLSTKCKLLRDSNGVFSIQLICKDSSSNTYSGTLITINMLELDQEIDIHNVNNLFNEVEVPQIKRRKVQSTNANANITTNASTNANTNVNEIEPPFFL